MTTHCADWRSTEQALKQLLGVPGFYRMENIVLGEGCTYRGQPSDCTLHLAVGFMGDVQIEITLPVVSQNSRNERANPDQRSVAGTWKWAGKDPY